MTDDATTAGEPPPADTLVETALRLLPTPDHAPGFWEDLAAALALEPLRAPHEPSLAVGPGRAPGSAARREPRRQVIVAAPSVAQLAGARPPVGGLAGGPDPSRLLVPPSLRRRSNAVLLLLVAAAVALVVICGAALLRNRSDTGMAGHRAPVAAAGADRSVGQFAAR